MITPGEEITIFIPGQPVPKARPRFRVYNGRVMTYTPKTTEQYEQFVAECVRKKFPDYKTYEGPVHLDMQFSMPVPKSLRLRFHTKDCDRLKPENTSAKIHEMSGTPYTACTKCKPDFICFYVPVFPTGKPDLDNLEKSISDGLQKSEIIKDDKQVISKATCKVYSTNPGVLVNMRFGGEI